DWTGCENQPEDFVGHNTAESDLRDREIVASQLKERISHPEREPVNGPPAQKPRPMLEAVIITINPDNEGQADKNDAARHATVRNSSPNPARHTRKIFVTASANDRHQTPGHFWRSAHGYRCVRHRSTSPVSTGGLRLCLLGR